MKRGSKDHEAAIDAQALARAVMPPPEDDEPELDIPAPPATDPGLESDEEDQGPAPPPPHEPAPLHKTVAAPEADPPSSAAVIFDHRCLRCGSVMGRPVYCLSCVRLSKMNPNPRAVTALESVPTGVSVAEWHAAVWGLLAMLPRGVAGPVIMKHLNEHTQMVRRIAMAVAGARGMAPLVG